MIRFESGKTVKVVIWDSFFNCYIYFEFEDIISIKRSNKRYGKSDFRFTLTRVDGDSFKVYGEEIIVK